MTRSNGDRSYVYLYYKTCMTMGCRMNSAAQDRGIFVCILESHASGVGDVFDGVGGK